MGTGGDIIRLAAKSCSHTDQHGAAIFLISLPRSQETVYTEQFVVSDTQQNVFASKFRISDPIFFSGTAYRVQMSIAVQRFQIIFIT
jgi:hypothetical protein